MHNHFQMQFRMCMNNSGLKLAKAYKQKIKVIINIISDIDNQASMDLCNLIGNMFDNAIEASQNSEKRFIYFEISQKNDNLNIFLKNSIDQSVLTSNPHLQSTKKSNNHGFGTSIIKEIAMRHHGIADFYEEDNCFCCNVIARF